MELQQMLQQSIDEALKQAIREKDENKRNALRLLLTAIKVKEKELKRPLGEVEIQQVISSQIKQRRDSAEQFAKGARQDLAQKEEAEICILQSLLPEPLSSEALERLIDEAIAETGARSQKDMGKIMKSLIPRIAGRADGKLVNDLVRNKIGTP